jgi:hypothetical protein
MSGSFGSVRFHTKPASRLLNNAQLTSVRVKGPSSLTERYSRSSLVFFHATPRSQPMSVTGLVETSFAPNFTLMVSIVP